MSNNIYSLILMHRLLTFPEPEYQINQPSDKRNHGNDPPECFLSDGPEILAYNVNNRQYRQQVKHNTDFYPYNYRCKIQFNPFMNDNLEKSQKSNLFTSVFCIWCLVFGNLTRSHIIIYFIQNTKYYARYTL